MDNFLIKLFYSFFGLFIITAPVCAGDPYSGFQQFVDSSSLKPFARDLGSVLGASSFHNGRSLGFSGFDVGLRGSYRFASEAGNRVLRDNGDELETIGSVDGLGRGERIYAVRFIEDRGYVVTFRQVDPLYVIDLSDPRRPTVEGELKIHGYSAYLHPVSDDLLLGVGQDADHNGRVTGLQASLFDVADPQAPERTDQFTMGDASSELEWDHHAFLFNPADGLTVIPFQRWDDKGARAGALVLEVTAAGIREIGIVSHNTKANRGWEMPVRRSLLIDGRLVTVSEAGVMMSAADTLDTLDWVEF